MKITRTKDGTVSFLQMTPVLAQLLVDLASDLSRERAAYLFEDGQLHVPSTRARTELAKVGRAYDTPTASTGCDLEWSDLWEEVDDFPGAGAPAAVRDSERAGDSTVSRPTSTADSGRNGSEQRTCYACDGTGSAAQGWAGNPSSGGGICPDCRGTGVDRTPYGTGSDHCPHCAADWRRPHLEGCPASAADG